MKNKTYSTFEVAKLLETTRSSIKQYLERGLIVPSVKEAEGKGSRNLFSIADLYGLRLFQQLNLAGISQRDASEIIKDTDFKKVKDGGYNWIHIIPYGWGMHKDKSKEKELPEDSKYQKAEVYVRFNLLQIKSYIDGKIKE